MFEILTMPSGAFQVKVFKTHDNFYQLQKLSQEIH